MFIDRVTDNGRDYLYVRLEGMNSRIILILEEENEMKAINDMMLDFQSSLRDLLA